MDAPVVREDLGGQASLLCGAVLCWVGLGCKVVRQKEAGSGVGDGGRRKEVGVGVAMAVDLDVDMRGVRVGSGQGKDLDSGELARLQD